MKKFGAIIFIAVYTAVITFSLWFTVGKTDEPVGSSDVGVSSEASSDITSSETSSDVTSSEASSDNTSSSSSSEVSTPSSEPSSKPSDNSSSSNTSKVPTPSSKPLNNSSSVNSSEASAPSSKPSSEPSGNSSSSTSSKAPATSSNPSDNSSSRPKSWFDISDLTYTQADVGKVVGYTSLLGKDITVVSIEEGTKSDGRKYIKTNYSFGSSTIIIECKYCYEFPCSKDGGKNCPKYDPLKDGTVYCQRCGKLKGDGYNGTCKGLIDWANGGKVSCNYYD